MMEGQQPLYIVEREDGNRYSVVRNQPTVVAKELRWEEAVRLANELNAEADALLARELNEEPDEERS